MTVEEPAAGSVRPGTPPSRRQLRLAAIGLATGVVLASAASWYVLDVLRRAHADDALVAERRLVEQIAQSTAEHARHVLDSAGLVVRLVASDPSTALSGRQFDSDDLRAIGIVQVGALSADGRLRWVQGRSARWSADEGAPIDLSQRDYFIRHRDIRDSGFFVGAPIFSHRTHQQLVPISHRISERDGRFAGVAVARLDPQALLRSGPPHSAERQIRARIVGVDGIVRADSGSADMPSGELGTFHVPATRNTPRGVRSVENDPVRPGERIVSITQPIAGQPLLAMIESRIVHSGPDGGVEDAMFAFAQRAVPLALALLAAAAFGAMRRSSRRIDTLLSQRAQAVSAHTHKSRFINTISHELRAPLSSINGYAELSSRSDTDVQTLRLHARAIAQASRQAASLLDDLLDYAKFEAGELRVSPAPTEVFELVAQCVELFEPIAREKQVALSADIDDAVPEMIVTDARRLLQVLTNLLGNAVKFTDRGEVRLLVTREGDWVRFAIIDTGPGIPAEYRAQIFERFKQGPSELSARHGGTGLGLELVRALCSLMNGRVWMESTPGVGTTFLVDMPVHHGSTLQPPPTDPQPPARRDARPEDRAVPA